MFCLAERLQNPLKRFFILDYEKKQPATKSNLLLKPVDNLLWFFPYNDKK